MEIDPILRRTNYCSKSSNYSLILIDYCLQNPMEEEPGGLQSLGSQKSQTRLTDGTTTHWLLDLCLLNIFHIHLTYSFSIFLDAADCMAWHILLLLLSCFSCVRLCATPYTAAHQAPPSLGFSRQEYWSGLPFPSPMHESEKWKWSRSVVSDS